MVKEVEDYVKAVKKEFPIFTESEINKILTYGLKRYAWINRQHCDVLVEQRRKDRGILTCFCGFLGFDSLKHYFRFITKSRMRERVLSALRKEEWDGYYYIGLTEKQSKNVRKRGKYVIFKDVYLTKLKKELYHLPFIKYIWRVPESENRGWRFFKETYKSDQAEYLGENKYEQYHQCFLKRDGDGQASPSDIESGVH